MSVVNEKEATPTIKNTEVVSIGHHVKKAMKYDMIKPINTQKIMMHKTLLNKITSFDDKMEHFVVVKQESFRNCLIYFFGDYKIIDKWFYKITNDSKEHQMFINYISLAVSLSGEDVFKGFLNSPEGSDIKSSWYKTVQKNHDDGEIPSYHQESTVLDFGYIKFKNGEIIKYSKLFLFK